MSTPDKVINILICLEECEAKHNRAIIDDIETLNIIHDALVYYLEGMLTDA